MSANGVTCAMRSDCRSGRQARESTEELDRDRAPRPYAAMFHHQTRVLRMDRDLRDTPITEFDPGLPGH